MNTRQLLNEILSIISTVKEDKNRLEKIHRFLTDEIYEKPEESGIPEKYKSLVAEVADYISAGEVCFVNTDTLEMEYMPNIALEDPKEFEDITGETVESLGMKHDEWENCIQIDPVGSYESFKIMEGFADSLSDKKFQQKLFDALNRKRPFANFKRLIDDSDYRQDWFDYRQAWLEKYAFELIESELNKS